MARPAPDRSGFTLVEILVALLISGLLVGVIFQIMEGQGRYMQVQSAREEVQQNARASVELIGSELRATPDKGIVAAGPDSIRFRLARVWGTVCETSNNNLKLKVVRSPGAWYAPNDGTALVVDVRSPGAATADWTAPVAVSSMSVVSSPPASCLPPSGVQPPEEQVVSLGVPGSPSTLQGATPSIGNVAYVFDLVTYLSGTSSGVEGQWIFRRVGSGSKQPFAGPIEGEGNTGTGLHFLYYDQGTVGALPFPISSTTLDLIDRVAVAVRAVSRNGNEQLQQVQVDTVMISLRNRR